MKVKGFVIFSLITMPLFGSLPELLENEMTEAESAMSDLFLSEIDQKKLEQTIGQFKEVLGKVSKKYPKGYRNSLELSRDEKLEIMSLETDLQFLEECSEYLLGGPKTKDVEEWEKTTYGYVYLDQVR